VFKNSIRLAASDMPFPSLHENDYERAKENPKNLMPPKNIIEENPY
jgi:hypothetical protein